MMTDSHPSIAELSARADDPLVVRIAENVDQLINLDISGYGVIADLYAAAHELYGEPVCLHAAKRLLEDVGRGDHVFVTAGWLMPGFYPYGETDRRRHARPCARARARRPHGGANRGSDGADHGRDLPRGRPQRDDRG